MKRIAILSFIFTLLFTVSVSAQTDTEDVTFVKLLEEDAAHNLNVAWQYFKLKKAYHAALMRTEETMAAHPSFTKMDEVLYVAGMSSYYLSEGKGKQKIDLKAIKEEDRPKYKPERLREDAVGYLGQLLDVFPESKYAGKARDTYNKLKPEK